MNPASDDPIDWEHLNDPPCDHKVVKNKDGSRSCSRCGKPF